MNKFEEIMSFIRTKLIDSLPIAIIAVIHWMNHSPGMSNSNLAIIMQTLGYTFNTSTMVLTVGETNYTYYQLLEYACSTLYPNEVVISYDLLKNAIAISFRFNRITDAQRITLEGLL